MKERPILFSGPMVRAVLDGRKSQTRRVVTDRHLTRLGLEIHDGIAFTLEGGQWNGMFESGSPPWCPYGIPGDRLWVRETWRFADEDVVGFRADDSHGEQSERVRVLAERYWHRPSGFAPLHWLPSIYMPRWASRITLQVEAVRVERLQDITGQDAKAEGCEPDWESFENATCDKEGWDEPEEFDEECEVEGDWVNYGRRLVETHEHEEWEADRTNYALRLAFRNLWESINGPGSWERNCWVWVVSFSVVNP